MIDNPIINELANQYEPITVENVCKAGDVDWRCWDKINGLRLDGYYNEDQLEALAIAMRKENV